MGNDYLSVNYRHDYKYLCDAMQNAVLKTRLRALLKPDVYTESTGCYRVRSLYFDTPEDSCYYDNENGIGVRDKYRIRIYNEDTSYISLEKKSKNRQMTRKQSCLINEDICRKLMAGQNVRISNDMSQEEKKLLSELQTKYMRPIVIVEYLRYPFVEQNTNIRVTFDENICSSNEISGFLNKRISVRPIMEKGMSILEMKWDDILLDYLKQQLQLDSLQWNSFSKYYLCRKYNMYGGSRI